MATMTAAATPVAAHRCTFSGNNGVGRATVCRHSVRFGAQKRHAVRKMRSFVALAAAPGEDEVAVLDGAPKEEPKLNKKPSPLERGGTLVGDAAEGMDPSPATLGKSNTGLSSGKFEDPRWKNGTWDLMQFAKDGKMDWDAVIDAEVLRRKWLEQNPEASSNDDPVVFDTATVPWWAWVKRFHLPEAELLNGRAAMLGFFAAYLIDSLTGVGLVDQTNSFFGKLLLFITVVGVLLIRKNEDITTLKKVVQESTFYDKQWQATWKDEKRSEEK